MNKPQISNCTSDDFSYILGHLTDYWDSDDIRSYHHPMFIHEFGDTAFVLKDEKQKIIGYLFGFWVPSRKLAYCHLVGIHHEHKRKGLGRCMYHHFIEKSTENQCTMLKAITSPTNQLSIDFHLALGMRLIGEVNNQGIPVIPNYSGPGNDRVVFAMDLS